MKTYNNVESFIIHPSQNQIYGRINAFKDINDFNEKARKYVNETKGDKYQTHSTTICYLSLDEWASELSEWDIDLNQKDIEVYGIEFDRF